jgi:hypothetical protein
MPAPPDRSPGSPPVYQPVWPVIPLDGGDGTPGPTSVLPPTGSVRRRRWPERLAFLAVLAATAAGLVIIAVHNGRAASKWRQLDRAQVQISSAAAHQIQTANTNIVTLNGEVRSLDTQVSTMQSQLSSVANQKEKAIDQTTVLKDLLAAAGQVANNLQECIAATDQLDTDLNAAVASGQVAALNSLQSEAATVDNTCQQAQNGNNALQAAIQNASS